MPKLKYSYPILLASILLGLISCDSSNRGSAKKIEIGRSITIESKSFFIYGRDHYCSWSSSDPAIADVDPAAHSVRTTVSGKALGYAMITATFEEEDYDPCDRYVRVFPYLLSTPAGLATDGVNLYVADSDNNVIRKFDIETKDMTVLAGSWKAGKLDGKGAEALFHGPDGIASDGTNLYVADSSNNAIRKVVMATGVVTTLAGSGRSGFEDGIGEAASFDSPADVATDGKNVYVADSGNNLIRKIVVETGEVTTLAGSGIEGKADGIGTAASFYNPRGLATDGVYLYVADSLNNLIRRIVIGSGEVTTFAGSGKYESIDGVGTKAALYSPCGLLLSGDSLFAATHGNGYIRQIKISSAEVTTFAGPRIGIASLASIGTPQKIASDGKKLFVSDTEDDLIRAIDLTTRLGTNFTDPSSE